MHKIYKDWEIEKKTHFISNVTKDFIENYE